jgi:hypothetical protein
VSCVRFDTAFRQYGESVRSRTKDDSEAPRWPLPLTKSEDLRVAAHRPGRCRGTTLPWTRITPASSHGAISAIEHPQ